MEAVNVSVVTQSGEGAGKNPARTELWEYQPLTSQFMNVVQVKAGKVPEGVRKQWRGLEVFTLPLGLEIR